MTGQLRASGESDPSLHVQTSLGRRGATAAGSPETRSRDGPRPHARGHTRSGPRGALSLLDGVRPHPEAPGLGGFRVGSKSESGGRGAWPLWPWASLRHRGWSLARAPIRWSFSFSRCSSLAAFICRTCRKTHVPEGHVSTLWSWAASALGYKATQPVVRGQRPSSGAPWTETMWVPEMSLRGPRVMEGRTREGRAGFPPPSRPAYSWVLPATG